MPGDKGSRVTGTLYFPTDVGYSSTARMLVEAGLALLPRAPPPTPTKTKTTTGWWRWAGEEGPNVVVFVRWGFPNRKGDWAGGGRGRRGDPLPKRTGRLGEVLRDMMFFSSFRAPTGGPQSPPWQKPTTSPLAFLTRGRIEFRPRKASVFGGTFGGRLIP